MESIEAIYERESIRSLLLAMLERYDRLADRSIGLLRSVLGDDVGTVPSAVCQELAAVIEIYNWERWGIDAHLKAGLPSHDEARVRLAERLENYSPDFEPELAMQTFFFWLRNFAWDARDEFGDAMLVDAQWDDQFLEMIAKFLWNQRKMLAPDAPSQSAPV